MVASDVQRSLLDDVNSSQSVRPEALVDPLLGTRLGNYELSFVLGKGAYGAVYKARDLTLGRYVAIKFLHEFLDKSHEAMFLQEAKAVAALGKHQAIVSIFEFSEYQGRKYFVLEFVGSHAGMLLRVHPKGLPVEMALRIGKESTEGLAYAHKHNIIHRDIKPANILLEIEGGSAKLADFGVARLFDPSEKNSSHAPGGTPAYMAPEVIGGDAGDARSDIFSQGVTLYELLTGTLPFPGTDMHSVMESIRLNRYTPLKDRRDLPQASVAIVEKCLAPRPEDRFQNANELVAALAACLAPQSSVLASLPPVDNVTRDEMRLVKLKAFQLAEDAKHNGCDKLATELLKTGVESFRNGEAYEQLKQYGSAKSAFGEAGQQLGKAIDRAKLIMEKLLALKATRLKMEEIRGVAETARAHELAPEEFKRAVAEEKQARAMSGVIKATEAYQSAIQRYAEALRLAMANGEAVLNGVRNKLTQFKTALDAEGLLPHLEMESVAVDRLIEEARAALPDFEVAKKCYESALAVYQGAVPLGRERLRIANEQVLREPLVVSGIELVWVPPGHFYMGSDDGSVEEEPRHGVTINHGFWMGKYPVTQAQWEAIMGENPSGFTGDPQLPVENVSWEDCQRFVKQLTGLGDGRFYLPSEAEWEYACRAGSTTDWCFGDDESMLADYAWSHDIAEGRTHPVGQKQSNAWGLHDMHGNVCEWCEDHRHQDYEGAPDQGRAWLNDEIEERITRGGSWCIITPECRSSFRGWYARPSTTSDFMGFRVCKVD